MEAYRVRGGIMEVAEFMGRYPGYKIKLECEERVPHRKVYITM
jgi:hypothetical protein